MTNFRLQRSEVQAPLAAPTYLTHITAPSFRRGRFITIAVVLHLAAIIAFLITLHLKYHSAPPEQPTLSLVVTDQPFTGSGQLIISPAPAPPVPKPAPAAQPPHPVPAPPVKAAPPVANARDTSPDAAQTAKRAALPLPAPEAPPPPAPAAPPSPSPPAAPSHLGDNQPTGSGLVMDSQVIPAKPDSSANQPPQYPREALEHHEQGRVLLSINVLPNGHPSSIKITTSSGFMLLDKAAAAAVMQWHFQPAEHAGKPVASVLPFWISFELN
jgi:protein TonB